MRPRSTPEGLPLHRYPADPWRLVEQEYSTLDLGATETMFAVGNGYLGMRANPSEGREAHSHGTYLNGFHETWPIHHAEDAFAFAKTGQTIVNAPDAKLMKLYVDDEPLLLSSADLEHYERVLDFRAGTYRRDVEWRTPAGKRIRVGVERMVSLQHRHLAMVTLEIELLDHPAPIVVSSQLLNRQDGEDEYHVRSAALGEGRDPRKARTFDHRVLEPLLQRQRNEADAGGEVTLGYRCTNNRMTVACAYQHLVQTTCEYTAETAIASGDLAKTVFTINGAPGDTVRITKLIAYHSSTGVPTEELADRCSRTLARARSEGCEGLLAGQRSWLDEYWDRTDVQIGGNDRIQQAVRFDLFHLAQASARTQEQGIAAKAVTAGGYD
ncbi:MAG: glycoside hydrolase family 65 protein, partial [Acidimicrobiales bacterium]